MAAPAAGPLKRQMSGCETAEKKPTAHHGQGMARLKGPWRTTTPTVHSAATYGGLACPDMGIGDKHEPCASPWPHGAPAVLGCRRMKGHTQTHQAGYATGQTVTGSGMLGVGGPPVSLNKSLSDKPRKPCTELDRHVLKTYPQTAPCTL